ncbi:MAG: polymer-forming cytoskeletal protein [Patescibacteria group bacterium]
MIKKLLFGAGVLFALSFSVPALATTTATDNETEFTQEFGGMLVSTGNAVRVQTATDKDVFLAGSMIRVEAPVNGDVFAAGNEVQILDVVNGSVRAAGNTVTIDSEIMGNVMAVGSTVIITKNAIVHGYVNAYGATIIIDGKVDKNVDVRGDQMSVNGILGGESYFEGSWLDFGASSLIDAPTTVRLSNAPVFQVGSQGQDLTTFIQLTQPAREADDSRFTAGDFFMWLMWSLFKYASFLLITIVLIAVFPSVVNNTTQAMHQKMGKTWGWGALAFLIMPSALVVVALTVIGLPLSLLASVVYVISLVLAEILTAVLVGRWLLKTPESKVTKGQLIGAAALGLALGTVVVSIPFLGGLVKMAAMMYGFGGILVVVFGRHVSKGK